MLVDFVGFARSALIGPAFPELLLQQVDGDDAVPGDAVEVAAHHADFPVHVLALFRGIDRHLGVAQFVQDEAVEAVVLAEAAGAVGRRHEEGAALGVEVRPLEELGQVAGGEDQRVALLAGGEAAAQLQGLLVGVRAGPRPRRRRPGRRATMARAMIGHGGQVNLALQITRHPVAVGRDPFGHGLHLDVLQAVQEGLQAGDGADVGGVFVDFDLEIRLAAHAVLEEVLDEGVGAAAEVGDEDAVEAGVAADVFGHAQDFLAEAPIHGLDFIQVPHLIHRQEVHGHGQDAQLPELAMQVEVHARVQGVVGPADEDHEAAVLGGGVEDFLAAGAEMLEVGLLGGDGPAHGPFDLEDRHPQVFPQVLQALAQPFLAPAEIEDRGEDFGVIGGKVDGDGRGVAQGLGHGADDAGLDLRVGVGHVDDAGQEDALDPGLEEVQEMAVGHLHRVAGLGGQGLDALVDHRLVGLLGIDHGEAQVLEEGPEEGHELLEEHGPGQADGAAFALLGGLGAVKPVFPLLEQVRQVVLLLVGGHFVLFAAAAVEQGLFAFDLHLTDFAVIGAAFALEGSDFIFAVGQVEALEPGDLPVALAHGQQRRADGPGDVVVGRHVDGLAADLLEGGDDAAVGRGGALVEDAFADGPVFGHFVQVVLDDGIGQARHQGLAWRRPAAGGGRCRIP